MRFYDTFSYHIQKISSRSFWIFWFWNMALLGIRFIPFSKKRRSLREKIRLIKSTPIALEQLKKRHDLLKTTCVIGDSHSNFFSGNKRIFSPK